MLPENEQEILQILTDYSGNLDDFKRSKFFQSSPRYFSVSGIVNIVMLVALRSDTENEHFYQHCINQALALLSVELTGLVPEKMDPIQAECAMDDILAISRYLEYPVYKTWLSSETQLYLASMLAHALNLWVYWKKKNTQMIDENSLHIIKESIRQIREALQKSSFEKILDTDHFNKFPKALSYFTYLSSTIEYMLNVSSGAGQARQAVEVFQMIALLYESGSYRNLSARAKQSLENVLSKTAEILREHPYEIETIRLNDLKWLFQSINHFITEEGGPILSLQQQDLAVFVKTLTQVILRENYFDLSVMHMFDALRKILKSHYKNNLHQFLRIEISGLLMASKSLFRRESSGTVRVKEKILKHICMLAIENHINPSFEGRDVKMFLHLFNPILRNRTVEVADIRHAVSEQIILLLKLHELGVLSDTDRQYFIGAALNAGKIIRDPSRECEGIRELNLHDFSIESARAAFMWMLEQGKDFRVVVGKGTGTREEKLIQCLDPIWNKSVQMNPVKHAVFQLIADYSAQHDLIYTYGLTDYGCNLNEGVLYIARTPKHKQIAIQRNEDIQSERYSSSGRLVQTLLPVYHQRSIHGSTGGDDMDVDVDSEDKMKIDPNPSGKSTR